MYRENRWHFVTGYFSDYGNTMKDIINKRLEGDFHWQRK